MSQSLNERFAAVQGRLRAVVNRAQTQRQLEQANLPLGDWITLRAIAGDVEEFAGLALSKLEPYQPLLGDSQKHATIAMVLDNAERDAGVCETSLGMEPENFQSALRGM